MATVDKNFRIKHGLVVEGTTGTINGNNILTENGGDTYILNLVGGATLVKSVDTTTFTVDGSGNLTVNSGVFDVYGAASSAQTASEGYTDSAVSTEATNRQTAINSALSVAEGYADQVSGNALTSANSYTDSSISSEVTRANSAYDAAGAASAAQTAAQSYADSLAVNYDAAGTAAGLAGNYDAAGAAATAQSNAESYADTVAGTAQSNAESYANTAASNALSSANTYTDGKVADLVGMAPSLLDTLEKIDAAIANDANFSTTLLTDIATAQATAESYTDSAISTEVTNRNSAIATAKTEAITAAESYADGLASNYDAAGSAGSAQSAAESYADSLVQNGNSSAIPTYQALNLGNYTELVSGWSSTSNGSTFIPLAWNANYGTAKLTVHVRDGVHSQASEVLIARDSANNIAITEYAIITTNGALADISAIYAGGVISLTVSPINGHTTVESVASGSVVVWAD